MADHLLAERRARLEATFFERHNQELWSRLVETEATRQQKSTLAAATGIADEAVLTRLAQFHIGPETLAAMAVVPMVLVAWADGSIAAREREAVLAGAHEAGLIEGSPAFHLLEAWLHERPGPDLLQAWEDYVHALTRGEGPEERQFLEATVMAQAHAVAAAAGSFLGLTSPVSVPENAVLRQLGHAFHKP